MITTTVTTTTTTAPPLLLLLVTQKPQKKQQLQALRCRQPHRYSIATTRALHTAFASLHV
uniref:Secreted protein n=1 Tax=Setaria digitata TaxID=48799 RepID=A0A915PSE7_9BILA